SVTRGSPREKTRGLTKRRLRYVSRFPEGFSRCPNREPRRTFRSAALRVGPDCRHHHIPLRSHVRPACRRKTSLRPWQGGELLRFRRDRATGVDSSIHHLRSIPTAVFSQRAYSAERSCPRGSVRGALD